MPTKTIVDASVPNAGRVYDFLLGGHHNFEIDRRAAEQIRTMMPFLPKLMRLFRWCLQDLAYELTYVRGYDMIVDFASGLPTADHLHTAVAPGTTIIYSDRDPVCVEYGREILEDTPNVHYFQADCRFPLELLGRPEVKAIMDGKKRTSRMRTSPTSRATCTASPMTRAAWPSICSLPMSRTRRGARSWSCTNVWATRFSSAPWSSSRRSFMVGRPMNSASARWKTGTVSNRR